MISQLKTKPENFLQKCFLTFATKGGRNCVNDHDNLDITRLTK